MSYKRLGDYIKKVNVRNTDSKISNLQGISMNKEFRKSTSNIVGTDLSKYKIVRKGQFCCDFMSVIRVHKFPVVLNNSLPLCVASNRISGWENARRFK